MSSFRWTGRESSIPRYPPTIVSFWWIICYAFCVNRSQLISCDDQFKSSTICSQSFIPRRCLPRRILQSLQRGSEKCFFDFLESSKYWVDVDLWINNDAVICLWIKNLSQPFEFDAIKTTEKKMKTKESCVEFSIQFKFFFLSLRKPKV